MTLEDVAMYVSRGGGAWTWLSGTIAGMCCQRVRVTWGDPGRSPLETMRYLVWASPREGGSLREAGCGWPSISPKVCVSL